MPHMATVSMHFSVHMMTGSAAMILHPVGAHQHPGCAIVVLGGSPSACRFCQSCGSATVVAASRTFPDSDTEACLSCKKKVRPVMSLSSPPQDTTPMSTLSLGRCSLQILVFFPMSIKVYGTPKSCPLAPDDHCQ